MMKNVLFAVAVICVVLVACKKDGCDYDECQFKAPASEIQAVQNYLNSQNITNATQHCSGMFYVIDTPGTGTRPNSCANVLVEYKGRLTNGAIFGEDTTTLSLGGLILGFRNGVPLIKEGGKIRLFIPPTLGYGGQGQGQSIPGNSILIFDVKLNSVQ
jgi:FKBP-type peptidyl-prolyl cis-trans isomerase FkpA